MATELADVLRVANPDFDVNKFTYHLALPPETLPKLYLSVESPVQSPKLPLYPSTGQTQTSPGLMTVQMTAEEHARFLQLSATPTPKPGILARIRHKLESIAPSFISFEDDDTPTEDELDYDPVDSPVQSAFREPTYASRYPMATAPPAVTPSPPQSTVARSVALPGTAVGLYQRISQRESASKLRSEGVTVADLMAADVKALDLRRAGYTLDEIGQLVPELDFLVRMGFDRSMLDEQWRVPVLADVYRTQVGDICQRFNLNLRDLERSKMNLDQLSAAGFTLGGLIGMGAGFDFLYALRSPPDMVSAKLKGQPSDLSRLNLSVSQKQKLCKDLGWSPQAMIGCFGLTPASSSRAWLPMSDRDLFGWQLGYEQ